MTQSLNLQWLSLALKHYLNIDVGEYEKGHNFGRNFQEP